MGCSLQFGGNHNCIFVLTSEILIVCITVAFFLIGNKKDLWVLLLHLQMRTVFLFILCIKFYVVPFQVVHNIFGVLPWINLMYTCMVCLVLLGRLEWSWCSIPPRLLDVLLSTLAHKTWLKREYINALFHLIWCVCILISWYWVRGFQNMWKMWPL